VRCAPAVYLSRCRALQAPLAAPGAAWRPPDCQDSSLQWCVLHSGAQCCTVLHSVAQCCAVVHCKHVDVLFQDAQHDCFQLSLLLRSACPRCARSIVIYHINQVEVDAVAAAAAAGGCADKGSDPNGCWARLKAVLGCPWQEMLCFAADATTLRDAAALGAATCRVRGVLRLDALERGLTTYSSKQSDDRGY
jgi:hypothetical protein